MISPSSFAVASALAVTAVVGGFNLYSAMMAPSEQQAEGLSNVEGLGDLDETLLARALEVDQAEAAPLDLAPAEAPAPWRAGVQSLAELAATDSAGAVDLVRQALIDDPTILEDAIAALETFRATQDEARLSQVIEANADRLFSDTQASVMGNPNGSITLVEFLDYNCHFCKASHDDILQLIEAEPDLRVLVRDFPVLGPGSLEAAQVALAFRAIGGDMEAFVHTMMSEHDAQADAVLARAVALDLGADTVALDLALDNPELMAPIAETYELAEQLDIRGTPAFILGGERLMGAVGFDRLREAIQAERQRLSAL